MFITTVPLKLHTGTLSLYYLLYLKHLLKIKLKANVFWGIVIDFNIRNFSIEFIKFN